MSVAPHPTIALLQNHSLTMVVQQEIERARSQGYSICNEELEIGLRSIAWRTNVGIARPSCGRMRGPYVLKMRATRMSTFLSRPAMASQRKESAPTM